MDSRRTIRVANAVAALSPLALSPPMSGGLPSCLGSVVVHGADFVLQACDDTLPTLPLPGSILLLPDDVVEAGAVALHLLFTKEEKGTKTKQNRQAYSKGNTAI